MRGGGELAMIWGRYGRVLLTFIISIPKLSYGGYWVANAVWESSIAAGRG